LDSVGVRLDVAGVPLALMAAAVTVVVVVEAADPVTALITGADAVARAVDDGMEVRQSGCGASGGKHCSRRVTAARPHRRDRRHPGRTPAMTRIFMNKPAAAPDGSFSVSWFNPGKAVAMFTRENVQFPDSGTYPDAGPVHPQRLYRTPGGRWALEVGANKFGYITPHQAREWLILTGEPDENITRWLDPVEEERGPGRPKAGDQVCFTVPATGLLTSGTGAPGRRPKRTLAGPAHPPAGSGGRAAWISRCLLAVQPEVKLRLAAAQARAGHARAGVCSPARPPRHPGRPQAPDGNPPSRVRPAGLARGGNQEHDRF
jgi:hypothetical protein